MNTISSILSVSVTIRDVRQGNRKMKVFRKAHRPLLYALANAIMVLTLSSCSLLTIESPATPLPERDLNARMLTREYALMFGHTVAAEANRITLQSDDAAIRLAALRWKISAITECLIAATQISPLISMLDTWSFAIQMQEFFESGDGGQLFGDHQQSVVDTAQSLSAEMREIVVSLSSPMEFERFQGIVNAHAAAFPITGVGLGRTSLINGGHWEEDDELLSLTTVGTASEAMSDIADRMRLYSAAVPASSRWQIELLALESGLDSEDVSLALARVDSHMTDLAEFADASPEMLDKAMRDLRATTRQASLDIEASALVILEAFAREREAIINELKVQQQILYRGIDDQRAAFTIDVERISKEISTDVWANIHQLTREVGAIIVIFFAVLLTLPFLAGVYVGRARASTKS
jgi:hypothetical protein